MKTEPDAKESLTTPPKEIPPPISVIAVEPDSANYKEGVRVTLRRDDGKIFKVNLFDDGWDSGNIYGLNLVFDHSGEGDHYY